MKFTLSWLKTYLDTDLSLQEIAQAMTMIGLEVEEIIDESAKLSPFSVAKVISAAKHPNADKLQVLQVDTIDGPKEIVCGAPNARAGLTTIYAPIGAYVPGLGVTLVEKPVRGVVSNGMMCSASELQLSDESDGIMELSDDLRVGTQAAELFGSEPVIDFEVTPNRPDWLGVLGIARDLAAAGAGTLTEKAIAEIKGTFPCPITIKVDGASCLFFAGRVVRGVKNGPSPKWLQDRLTSVGLRPINALVDITNFMSIDRARPLHVYDMAKLTGATIVAGLAPDGERLNALDGKAYGVTGDMCAIMDGSGIIGLGGLMGGENTGCADDTRDVFVESAWFDPVTIAQMGRITGINSDAGYRFARGVDPQFTVAGLEMATQMILDLCGGEASEVATKGTLPENRDDVAFDPSYVAQLTGLSVSDDKIAEILSTLGFGVTRSTPWSVSVPSWRRDVDGKADLVEEVARIYGFNEIPATPLPVIAPKSGGVLTPKQTRARIARRALAALGHSEAVTWSFMPHDKARLFGGGIECLKLANPIAAELNTMRPSIIPNLLEAAGRNGARGFDGARLFEIGPVYENDTPAGQSTAIAAIIAPSKQRTWGPKGEDGLFALKGDVLALLEAMNVATGAVQLVQGSNAPHWHPGRSARLQLGPKTVLAEFGELHPSILKAFDLSGAYVGFDIRLEALPVPKAKASKSRGGLSRSNLMPLSRDFAFVVDQSVSAQEVIRAVKSADKTLIVDVHVFDVYEGKGVPDGHKSLALEVVLQPLDKTLNDAEIDTVSQNIVAAAQKVGANLRS
jgi:phenylalanyl-tRNA synthetase beta chain